MSESHDIAGTNDRPEIVKAHARVLLLESVWRWFIGLVVASILVLVIVDTMQGRTVRQELLSCGVEGGACYERSQTRIKDAIAAIYNQGLERESTTRQIILLANYCEAEAGPDLDNIVSCVNRRLDNPNKIKIEEEP